ncbi:MAG: Holliday junction branch migration protein RuvA [Desulfovibrionales bacterium]
MIAFVAGKLLGVLPKSCLVLTSGGVGYEIHLPEKALKTLPAAGEGVEFYVQTVVREDVFDLYGFSSLEERETFSLLLSIHQLGPKTALAVLSLFDPSALQRIVAVDDIRALTRVPGIGEKTAKKIMWDLKDRFRKSPIRFVNDVSSFPRPGGVFEDVLAALCNLGYREDEVRSVLRGVLDSEPDLDVEGAVRAALKGLASRRGS